jgi:hypothetical protein
VTDIKQDIATEAVRIVTGARRSAYGTPEQNFERIARLWNGHLINTGVIGLTDPGLLPRDVAAFMRLMKEARLAETPDHRDSYVDLVGYALCGAEVAGVKLSETEQPEAEAGLHADAEGWIPWEGGECPVDRGAHVRVKLRNGLYRPPAPAVTFRWSSSSVRPGTDIVAYRVVEAADAGDWIPWEGGECPVDENATVETRLRGGGGAPFSDLAGRYRWGHAGAGGDIVAYRVVKP